MAKRRRTAPPAPPTFRGRGAKDIRQLLDRYPDWMVRATRGGHLRITGPGGEVIIVSTTPGSFREVRILRSALRRAEREANPPGGAA